MTAPSHRNPSSPPPNASASAPTPLQQLPAGLVRLAPVLSALQPEQLNELLRFAGKRRFQRGEWILRQGERNGHLHVLLSGRAHHLREDTRGREVILDIVRPGEHFGELSLIDNLPCSRSVRSALTSDVLLIEGHAIARVMPQRPELSAALTRGLVHRLRQARHQITSLALYDVEGRMVRLLCHLAEPESPGVWRLQEKLSRQELARMVGASREMVSRIMVELESRGVLQPLPDGSLRIRGEWGPD